MHVCLTSRLCYVHVHVGHILSSDLDLSLEGGLEARLEQVKQLREKIEKLRTVVSEHFASQLSSACNVQ